MAYDLWSNTTSRNGMPADELIAGLQKSIRRADAEIAVRIAYEMYISGEQFEEKLWLRLTAIAVEDIGFGDPYAICVINNLDEARNQFRYTDGDRPLFFVYAIRYLCAQPKERTTDDFRKLTVKKFAQGYVPEVPDYAFDVHTAKGRAKGRDIIHFIDVASQVTPQMEGYDDTYRLKFREILKNEMENNIQPKEGSFEFTID